MEGQPLESRQYFDTVAPQWDNLRKGFFSEAVREKAFAVAGVVPGKLAADIGAGSGFVTEGLLEARASRHRRRPLRSHARGDEKKIR